MSKILLSMLLAFVAFAGFVSADCEDPGFFRGTTSSNTPNVLKEINLQKAGDEIFVVVGGHYYRLEKDDLYWFCSKCTKKNKGHEQYCTKCDFKKRIDSSFLKIGRTFYECDKSFMAAYDVMYNSWDCPRCEFPVPNKMGYCPKCLYER